MLALVIIMAGCGAGNTPDTAPAGGNAPESTPENVILPNTDATADEITPPEITPTPEPAPEVEPEVTPEVTPEVVPEVVPEVTPEVQPEVVPEPTPEPTPEPEPAPLPDEPGYIHEQVPILMYHEVNDLLANSLYLSVADFTAHLDYFEQAGITPISMQQLYDHWFCGANLPEKPVVLTFDDGYVSMYNTVYPLLRDRGWTGTFFCITDARLGENSLSEQMIAEMAANGMEIGSHTVSHWELDSLSDSSLTRQLQESKAVLTDITGCEITALCYPAGKYNDDTQTAAAQAGYLCAVTTKNGFAEKSQGMFALKRIRVSEGYGAYWLKNALAPLGY